MHDPTPVLIPLVNPNEPEAMLAGIHVKEGQHVAVNEVLCTLETTKSTAEVIAETPGYVLGLSLVEGQSVRAGDVFCYLGEVPGQTLPTAPQTELTASLEQPIPEGLRITQPALALAREHNIALSTLPSSSLVTETIVRQVLQSTQPVSQPMEFAAPSSAFDPAAIIIYGGGGHGKAVIDMLRTLGTYRIVGIIDDGLPGQGVTSVMGVPILGGAEALPELTLQGICLAANAVGGIGNISIRIKIFERLAEAGFTCPVLVHPSAVVEHSAKLSAGVHVFPLAYVGSEAEIGFGVIINTRAVISHECHVDAYANISPGAILAGQVQVGAAALVGMGATINLQAKIGHLARIGNGATVKSDVPDNGIVRAGTVWPD
jgi:sugar O-acyltransferase (sialic acid O-acetyltransferase NeuD family)